MKFLFDMFPVILFFVAFKFYDIYVATVVAIVATALQIGWLMARKQKIEPMLWISLGVIAVFGGATIIFQNETFIKWKPTVLYWLFAGVLGIAATAFNKNLMRTLMEKQITLPDLVWERLLASWIGFFVAMGVLNLYVAYNYSTDAWVNFKLFGGMGLMLLFVFAQALMLSKHIQEKSPD